MSAGALERRYRRLLLCYPRAWRREHGDELVGVLLDQASDQQRSKVGISEALDLAGHGLEARVDALVRRVPERLRRLTASVALVVAAGIALLLLVGEVIGARHRPPADEMVDYVRYLSSGPFLTIGVGLYLAFISAALLVVLARPGLARVVLLAGSAYAIGMLVPAGTVGYPVPRVPLLLMCAGLGLLASFTTLELDRRDRRRLVGAGAGFITAVGLGLLLTKPLLGWGIGTMTSSGNVALAALATALPLVSGGAILVSTALVALPRVRLHADWPAALAVAALPLVIYSTCMSILVNSQAHGRAFIPALYVLVVALVATVVKRRRRVAVGH